MDDKTKELFKGLLIAPIVAIVVLLGMYFFTSNGSVFDFVADRVIERMDAKYSPYGPTPPTVKQR